MSEESYEEKAGALLRRVGLTSIGDLSPGKMMLLGTVLLLLAFAAGVGIAFIDHPEFPEGKTQVTICMILCGAFGLLGICAIYSACKNPGGKSIAFHQHGILVRDQGLGSFFDYADLELIVVHVIIPSGSTQAKMATRAALSVLTGNAASMGMAIGGSRSTGNVTFRLPDEPTERVVSFSIDDLEMLAEAIEARCGRSVLQVHDV